MIDLAALARHPAVRELRLAGSRAEGREGPWSDWDFVVETEDFARLADELSELVAPLAPLAAQWDRLSPHACFMLVLRGPVKIDLIFPTVPHEREPPWRPDAGTLAALDAHFWDWALWLAGKRAAGKAELVAGQLRVMHEHLLAPLGVPEPPASLADAVEAYRNALARAEERLGVRVPRELDAEVGPTIA